MNQWNNVGTDRRLKPNMVWEKDWRDAAAEYHRLRWVVDFPRVGTPPREAPHIICLCGSTRFIDTFAVQTWELELQGHIVLGCTLLPAWYCPVRDHFAEEQGVKEQRDEHHLRKIDLADEVLVLNVGGYIGESTRHEIEYAHTTGKPVRYLEELRGLGDEGNAPAVVENHWPRPSETPPSEEAWQVACTAYWTFKGAPPTEDECYATLEGCEDDPLFHALKAAYAVDFPRVGTPDDPFGIGISMEELLRRSADLKAGKFLTHEEAMAVVDAPELRQAIVAVIEMEVQYERAGGNSETGNCGEEWLACGVKGEERSAAWKALETILRVSPSPPLGDEGNAP